MKRILLAITFLTVSISVFSQNLVGPAGYGRQEERFAALKFFRPPVLEDTICDLVPNAANGDCYGALVILRSDGKLYQRDSTGFRRVGGLTGVVLDSARRSNDTLYFRRTDGSEVAIRMQGVLINGVNGLQDSLLNKPTFAQSDARYFMQSGSYANPAAFTSWAWSKITSTPTTLSGYGITDAVPVSRTILPSGSGLLGGGDMSANRTFSLDFGYLDDRYASGYKQKEAVRAATIANITLSGTQTVDGVALIAGDRILVKNQTAAADNGIYVVAAGVWSRSSDFDAAGPGEIEQGAAIFVQEGVTQAKTGWSLSTAPPITVGVTPLTFIQYAGANSYAAGTGLNLVGNTFSAQTTTALWNALQLRGVGISATAPVSGQLLRYDGSNWSPFTPNYLTANQNITLSGDVTGSGTTSIATTIANGAVTYAKMQNVTASRLLGRYTASNGVAQEIQIGSGLSLNNSTGVLTATGNGGTVTSVGLSLPSIFSVTGSPVTGSGTLTGSLVTQAPNSFFAAPNGSSGVPSFRVIHADDIPTLPTSKLSDLSSYASFTNYYTKTNLQTSGQAAVHWGNLTNVPASFPTTSNLQTVLSNGNNATNSITLGAAGNTSQYIYSTIRSVSSVDYTSAFGGYGGATPGAFMISSAPSVSSKVFILPNGGTTALYSPNGGTTTYDMWHSNNHPAGWGANNATFTGASVPALIANNSAGHITNITSRILTAGDIDAVSRTPSTVSWNDYIISGSAALMASSTGAPNANPWYGFSTGPDANNAAQFAMRGTDAYFRTRLGGVTGAWTPLATQSWVTSNFAASSGSGNYINNTTSAQSTSNFWISGQGVTNSNFQIRAVGSNSLTGRLTLYNADGTRGVNFQLNGDTNPGLATWIHSGSAWVKRQEYFADGNTTFYGNVSNISFISGHTVEFARAGANYIKATDAAGYFNFITGNAASSDATAALTLSPANTATFRGNVVTTSTLQLGSIPGLGSAATAFLTHTGGLIQARTAAQVRSDISAQVAGSYVNLQGSTPGTAQTGHINISGTLTTSALTSPSSSDLSITASSNHSILFNHGGANSGTWDADGRLGIGTTPNALRASLLEVAGNVWSTDAYLLGTGSTPVAEFFLTGSDAGLRTMSTQNLVFNTNANTERMRIDGTSGNVLIGTASDNNKDKLQVNGSASVQGFTAGIITITGNLTVIQSNHTIINRANTGNPLVTLPLASQNLGRIIVLVEEAANPTANNMNWQEVTSGNGVLYKGSLYTNFVNPTLSSFSRLTIQSDGTNWVVISGM